MNQYELDSNALERDAFLEFQDSLAKNTAAYAQANARPPLEGEVQGPPVPEGFVAPFATEEGMRARGLIDETGQATQLGEDYLMFEDIGAVKDGDLTTKGRAMVTPIDELLNTEKWASEGYKTSKEDAAVLAEINRLGYDGAGVDKSIGDEFSDLAKGLFSMAKAAGTAVSLNPSQDDEANLADQKIKEGLLNAPEQGIVKLASFGVNNVAVPIGKALGFLSEEEATEISNQRNLKNALIEKQARNNETFLASSVLDFSTEALEVQERVKEQLITENGKEKGDAAYQDLISGATSLGAMAGDPLNVVFMGGGAVKGLLGVRNAQKVARQASLGAAAVAEGNILLSEKAVLFNKGGELTAKLAETNKLLQDAVQIGNAPKALELTKELKDLSLAGEGVNTALSSIDEGIAAASTKANDALTFAESVKTISDVSREFVARGAEKVAQQAERLGDLAAKGNASLAGIEESIGRYRTTAAVAAAAAVVNPALAGSVFSGRMGLLVAPMVLQKTAKFANAISEEMIQRASSTPFFRRLAANEKVGTLGGAMASLFDAAHPFAAGVGRFAKGTAETLPATTLYNAVNSNGFDESSFTKGMRDALVFGGMGSVVGGRADFQKIKLNEKLNYRDKLAKTNPEALKTFDGIRDEGLKGFAASVDAAYPGAFEWKFTTEGSNMFDPQTRTAVVNINDRPGFVKQVAAHEIQHMINFTVQNDAAISAIMLGDTTQGGLVRAVDGSFDPEFTKWGDSYNFARKEAGLPEADLATLANEYFTDIGTQTLLEDVGSGRVAKQARKTPLQRRVEGVFSSAFSAIPIVKKVHFTLGGAIDGSGRMIPGSGLLSEGIKELPQVRSMVRKAYEESAGRPTRRIPQEPAPSPIPQGPIKGERGKLKQVIEQADKASNDAGKPLIGGRLNIDEKGNGSGLLSPEHLKALEEARLIGEGDFSKAVVLTEMMNSKDKFAVFLINKPVAQGRSKQYEGLAEGYVVPTNWRSQYGKLYVDAMDLLQLGKNVEKAVGTKLALDLGLNRNSILQDIQESVDAQNKTGSSDSYYKSKDPVRWLERKRFINAVIGQMTKKQKSINPLMGTVSPSLESGIFRTFLFDQLQSVVKANEKVSIPFGQGAYYNIKANLMPQAPRMNSRGDLIKEQGPSFMPRKAPQATRLASDIAKKNKVPLSKVSASGSGGEITPNDVRGYMRKKSNMLPPLWLKNPETPVIEPVLSDLVGKNVSYSGYEGVMALEDGRPVINTPDGKVVEVESGDISSMVASSLGIKLTGQSKKDIKTVIEAFPDNSKKELHSVFGQIDGLAEKVADIAETAASKAYSGEAASVIQGSDLRAITRGITDADLLHAWERTEKALEEASKMTSLTNASRDSIIRKFRRDITNIEKLSDKVDQGKKRRDPVKSPLKRSNPASNGRGKADLIERAIAGERVSKATEAIPSISTRRTVQEPIRATSGKRSAIGINLEKAARMFGLPAAGQADRR